MKIRVNGKDMSLVEALTLRDLIMSRNVDMKIIVVEYNGKIVCKDDLNKIALKDGDKVEIINFVGGG